VSRVFTRPARHIINHFGDESFQAITCTGTNKVKPDAQNKPNIVNLYTNYNTDTRKYKKTQ